MVVSVNNPSRPYKSLQTITGVGTRGTPLNTTITAVVVAKCEIILNGVVGVTDTTAAESMLATLTSPTNIQVSISGASGGSNNTFSVQVKEYF